MRTYTVCVQQIISYVIDVEAESKDDAERSVLDDINSGEIELSSDSEYAEDEDISVFAL